MRTLTRRDVFKRAALAGLSVPSLVALAAACGPQAPPAPATVDVAPTAGPTVAPAAAAARRGGGGTVRLLWWQAPTNLNSHLSLATKDVGAIRIYAEPLADFDANLQLVPVLAAEIPTVANGGVAPDRASVTWKLKRNVVWHDGRPFTAADVAFTFKFLSNPATGATTLGYYQNVAAVDALADDTVKVTFKAPVAAWFTPFTGAAGQILPEHALKDFVGEAAKAAPFQQLPIGTGPYRVSDFKSGDAVTYAINSEYYEPGKPFFDTVILKGGGDATSAARGVLQTGEVDWAWNLQIEPAVLNGLNTGRGRVVTWPGFGTEKLIINHTDPQTELDGQLSSYKVPHPHFQDLRVRQALALALQRDVIASTLYGPGASATGYTMSEVARYMPKDIGWEFNLDTARQLLDAAGAQKGADGIRVLNGRKMSWLFGASTNTVRQKEQEIIKSALQQLGIEVEIKAVDASAYFAAANPDSFQQLRADLGIEANAATVYPLLWYLRYVSADPVKDLAQKENNWAGRNIMRYQNPRFNDLYAQTVREVDPATYTELFLQLQSLVVKDVADIGLVSRNNVSGAAISLTGYEPTPWAQDSWDIKNWKRV
ncbi:MAG TPA: peptide ABC transporter substrate-binding protein [Chloroflexota bacterium]|nr:peptide ABC transporter substrate-binding protein [Chloroflexota bacterium]